MGVACVLKLKLGPVASGARMIRHSSKNGRASFSKQHQAFFTCRLLVEDRPKPSRAWPLALSHDDQRGWKGIAWSTDYVEPLGSIWALGSLGYLVPATYP